MSNTTTQSKTTLQLRVGDVIIDADNTRHPVTRLHVDCTLNRHGQAKNDWTIRTETGRVIKLDRIAATLDTFTVLA